MPISLGFWEWGSPKRGDAHITVTPVPVFATLETMRELEPKCVPQLFLGLLLGDVPVSYWPIRNSPTSPC